MKVAIGTVHKRLPSIVLRAGTYSFQASLSTNNALATATVIGVRADTLETIVSLTKTGVIGVSALVTYVNAIDGLEVDFFLFSSIEDSAALLNGLTVHKQ